MILDAGAGVSRAPRLDLPRGSRRRVPAASPAATSAHRVPLGRGFVRSVRTRIARRRQGRRGPGGSRRRSASLHRRPRALARQPAPSRQARVGRGVDPGRRHHRPGPGRRRRRRVSPLARPLLRLPGRPVLDGDRAQAPARPARARRPTRPDAPRHPDLPGPRRRPDAPVPSDAFPGRSGRPDAGPARHGQDGADRRRAASRRAGPGAPVHRSPRGDAPEGDLRRRRPVPRPGLGAGDLVGRPVGGARRFPCGPGAVGVGIRAPGAGGRHGVSRRLQRRVLRLDRNAVQPPRDPRAAVARCGAAGADPGLEDDRGRRRRPDDGLRFPGRHRRRSLAGADR